MQQMQAERVTLDRLITKGRQRAWDGRATQGVSENVENRGSLWEEGEKMERRVERGQEVNLFDASWREINYFCLLRVFQYFNDLCLARDVIPCEFSDSFTIFFLFHTNLGMFGRKLFECPEHSRRLWRSMSLYSPCTRRKLFKIISRG